MASDHSNGALRERLIDLSGAVGACGNEIFHVALECDAGIYPKNTLWLAVEQLQHIKKEVNSLNEELGSEAAE